MPTYSDVVRDGSGYDRPVVAGAQVYLLNAGDTLATADKNPVFTDDYGVFKFTGVPDGVYFREVRYGGVPYARDSVIVGTPPDYVGPKGDTGSANNTYPTIAGIAASPTTNLSAILAPEEGSGLTGATYTWKLGDYTGRNDVIASTWVNPTTGTVTPINQGAWVLPDAASITFRSRTQDSKNRDFPSLRDYGAKGTGNDDTSAFVQAAAELQTAYGGGSIYGPEGRYGISSAVTLPPRIGFRGPGSDAAIIDCLGSGFQSVEGAGDDGMTVFSGFRMIGADRNTGTAIAIAMNAARSRIRGVRFSDVNISDFQKGIHGRSMWDSRIAGCSMANVSYGIVLQGQCVSPTITNTQIISNGAGPGEGSVYGDGSTGILVDDYTYSDGTSSRPEDVTISDQCRIFGFDKLIDLKRALSASVKNCGIDGALRIGIDITTVDYRCEIGGNYIAAIHDDRGTIMLRANAMSQPNSSLLSIYANSFAGAGVYSPNSIGIEINGSNRIGQTTITENNVGQGAGVGTALSLKTCENITVTDNYLVGQVASYERINLGGHVFQRNTFNGPISRPVGIAPTPDRFEDNVGTAITGLRGPRLVTIPADQTAVTVSLASLGLSGNPVTVAPSRLTVVATGVQVSGKYRGPIDARYDGSGNIVVAGTGTLPTDPDAATVSVELRTQ